VVRAAQRRAHAEAHVQGNDLAFGSRPRKQPRGFPALSGNSSERARIPGLAGSDCRIPSEDGAVSGSASLTGLSRAISLSFQRANGRAAAHPFRDGSCVDPAAEAGSSTGQRVKARRFFAITPSRLSYDFTNFSIPSRSSTRLTSSKSMPAAASASSTRCPSLPLL
jgi:hypothetical protein